MGVIFDVIYYQYGVYCTCRLDNTGQAMLISTFNSLLQAKHTSAAYAYVPDVYGKQVRAGNKVCVVYSESSKVYTYNGSIHAVAERLGLIPEINIRYDAELIAGDLLNGLQFRGYAASIDTVRYILGDKVSWVSYTHDGVDDYDNNMAVYAVTDKPSWCH